MIGNIRTLAGPVHFFAVFRYRASRPSQVPLQRHRGKPRYCALWLDVGHHQHHRVFALFNTGYPQEYRQIEHRRHLDLFRCLHRERDCPLDPGIHPGCAGPGLRVPAIVDRGARHRSHILDRLFGLYLVNQGGCGHCIRGLQYR